MPLSFQTEAAVTKEIWKRKKKNNNNNPEAEAFIVLVSSYTCFAI